MKCITVGLDLGMESVKLVDHLGEQIIPNVLARSSVLQVYDDRLDPADYINFDLVSDIASGGFFMGNLAARQDSGRTLFMPANINKAEVDQYYVSALGAMAYRAVTNHLEAGESDLAVRLVISLPMRDWFKSRTLVETKLKGEHLLVMGSIPGFSTRTVSLHIIDVYAAIEGMAALIHNVFNANGTVKNPGLRNSIVRIVDLGKGTMDLPKINRMVPCPNPESTWEDWGAGQYLDTIARKALDKYGITVPNTAVLTNCLLANGGLYKIRGRSYDLGPIAVEEFEAMAERTARTVEAHFTNDVDACMLVGGAADAVRPYLGNYLDLNTFPVTFGEPGQCALENARGNYVMGLGRKWAPVENDFRVA